jgi:hypothetical protein
MVGSGIATDRRELSGAKFRLAMWELNSACHIAQIFKPER